jgi:GT2 family glycosyltransferase
MLRIIAATRSDHREFPQHALLGRSLVRVTTRPDVQAVVTPNNSAGLPEIYNAALARAADEDVLVFTHDDAWLDDWFLPERLADALARFAVVGVAGNRRRVPRQPAWYCQDTTFNPDFEHLSGAIGHVRDGAVHVSWYGTAPDPVKLLDGVFLAARAGTLRGAGVAFDPRFPFHFYDLDFCRACERAGLEMGTWPIAVTHGSGGQFGTPDWGRVYADYLAKWGD